MGKNDFLNLSIQDNQNAIRGIDSKINTMIALQIAPIPMLLGAYKFSSTITKYIGPILFIIIVVIFILTWLFAILSSTWCLFARHGQKINIEMPEPSPKSTYFLNPTTYIQQSKNKKSYSLERFIKDLPDDDSKIEHELAFELLKISIIRDFKMQYHRIASILSLVWLIIGFLGFVMYAIIIAWIKP
ncbi:hypothetical protein [Geothrix terrae]|uniref:hypothetical protein n=1 Tax=Geothrix terrae TaxID=2922720 RepID=UPI001FAD7BF4|nr:hypothetical protein [Geothrix terrae]